MGINKQIVINPKYSRHHNYEGYVKDNELFREQLNMNNDTLKKAIIESEEKLYFNNKLFQNQIKEKEEQIDISKIPYIIEDLIGIFNSIKMGFPNGMTESRYKYFLEQLSHGFNDISKLIPLLKTNDEVKKEQDKKYSMFSNKQHAPYQSEPDGDLDWENDIDWEFSVDEYDNKTL